METRRPYDNIDFIPTENSAELDLQVRDWLIANAFMGLSNNRHIDLMEYTGGGIGLTLGGYVPDPTRPGKLIETNASFYVYYDSVTSDGAVLDPEGTMWYCSRYVSRVSWASWGSEVTPIARLRADMINMACELGARFDERFKGTLSWKKGMTKEVREANDKAHAEKRARDATYGLLTEAIKTHIHTDCRNMRVGAERWVGKPVDAVSGEYSVALEGKEYTVHVNENDMDFTRTK